MALTRVAAQPNPTQTILAALANAIATNRQIVTDADAYLAIEATATNVQVKAQVKALTQEVQQHARELVGICRLLSRTLDAAN